HRWAKQQRHVSHHANAVLREIPQAFYALGRLRQRRAQIAQADQKSRERLADLVVQLARDRPALVFLRLHQTRRKILEPLPGFLRFALEAQNPRHTAGREQEPETQSDHQRNTQPDSKLREQLFNLDVVVVQLALV